MTDAGETQGIRDRLERFGDPRESWRWESGEVDYVAQFGLTAFDVPKLLTIAREWAEPIDWPADKGDMSGYAPVHAWRCLAQLGATEAVDLLGGMMDPLDAEGDDWYMEEFPHAFAWIGPASLGPLRDYLADHTHAVYPRAAVADGLRHLAGRHPETRDDVVKVLSDALSRFEDTDESLNAFIITYLLDLKATEANEMIERAYAADRVDISVNGNWNDVREELGIEGLGLVPEHLASQTWNWLPSDFERVVERLANPPRPSFEAEPSPPLQASRKVGRNDPCPCGSGKKYKKCCGR